MSGVSLLPVTESSHEADKGAPEPKAEPEPKQAAQQAGRGSLSLIASVRAIELQLVAFVVVFSATGFVPVLDLVFPTLASLYLVALSRLAFPSNGSTTSSSRYRVESQQQSSGSLFRVVGAIVGLLLPLGYALGGIARGDERAVRSVTPHLFLLSCQILTEIVASGASLFSPPVIALVPLLYSVRRISIILHWIDDVWINQRLPVEPQVIGWQGFGKWLAVGNLLYSSANLLFFLIPSLLPAAFERYFRERDEGDKKIKMVMMSGEAEDKPSAAPDSNLLKKKLKKSD